MTLSTSLIMMIVYLAGVICVIRYTSILDTFPEKISSYNHRKKQRLSNITLIHLGVYYGFTVIKFVSIIILLARYAVVVAGQVDNNTMKDVVIYGLSIINGIMIIGYLKRYHAYYGTIMTISHERFYECTYIYKHCDGVANRDYHLDKANREYNSVASKYRTGQRALDYQFFKDAFCGLIVVYFVLYCVVSIF